MLEELNDYITILDNADKVIIDNKVAEQGIEKYLTQQLYYLDCSRRYKDGSRAMQSIGYPYRREITSYLYVLDKDIDINKKEWEDKLINLHKANLEYEKENPPVWYGGKKAKDKWLKDHNATKLPRRRKVKEQTIPGMGKELSNIERLKRLSAEFGNLTFKLKINK